MSFRVELGSRGPGNAGPPPAIWHDVNLADPGDRDWLAHASGVDQRAQQLLLDPPTAPRRVKLDHGFFVTLHGSAGVEADQAEGSGSVVLLIEKNRVLSAHTGRNDGIEAIRTRSADGCGPNSPLELLTEMAIDYADRFENQVAEISDETEHMEDRVLSQSEGPPLAAVATLRHRAFRLRRPIVALRNLFNVVAADRSLSIDDHDRVALSTATEHVGCHLETLEDARERLLLLHDRMETQMSAQMNRVSYNLTVVATVFLPLTFVTGLLGMNVAGMPEAHDPWGFWVVCGLLTMVAVGCWWFLHWRRWI